MPRIPEGQAIRRERLRPALVAIFQDLVPGFKEGDRVPKNRLWEAWRRVDEMNPGLFPSQKAFEKHTITRGIRAKTRELKKKSNGTVTNTTIVSEDPPNAHAVSVAQPEQQLIPWSSDPVQVEHRYGNLVRAELTKALEDLAKKQDRTNRLLEELLEQWKGGSS